MNIANIIHVETKNNFESDTRVKNVQQYIKRLTYFLEENNLVMRNIVIINPVKLVRNFVIKILTMIIWSYDFPLNSSLKRHLLRI